VPLLGIAGPGRIEDDKDCFVVDRGPHEGAQSSVRVLVPRKRESSDALDLLPDYGGIKVVLVVEFVSNRVADVPGRHDQLPGHFRKRTASKRQFPRGATFRSVDSLALSTSSIPTAGVASPAMSETTPRLRITRRSGNVRVNAEPGAALVIEGGTGEMGEDGVLDIRPRGGGLLDVTCAAGSDLTISTISGNIDVRGDAGSVKVITKSGSVSIERATAVNARGASGRVEVGECEGECRVSFTSSNVSLGEVGRAVVATVSGNIDVDEADDAEVKTVSGNISLGARGGGTMAARSISGSVKVSVPDGSRPATRLRAVSGKVRCEPQPGEDGEVKIKSVSGSISVTCR
jgi:hypothetical protein